MAIETPDESNGNSTGTMDPISVDYFHWSPDDSPITVHMHLVAVDGIAHDVIEGFGALPRRGAEVGGLLLGRVLSGDRPTVWIERYQRIPCEHRFGPQFVLDGQDMAALEDAAANVLQNGELAVVGLYRSHTRPGFQLEPSDFDLIRRYFSDPSDLVLLVKPDTVSEISGRFFVRDGDGSAQPAGEAFPFRGKVVTPDTAATARGNIAREELRQEAPPPPAPREPVRRLVPDFAPSPVEPSPSVFGLNGYGEERSPEPDIAWTRREEPTEHRGDGPNWKKWVPLTAALLLVGGLLWFLLQPGRHLLPKGSSGTTNEPVSTTETNRPLGLYVDAAGTTWRAIWNPNATALHNARTVQLFVREGDDQTRPDLTARDLATGSYQYKPIGGDVTFRLEVVDSEGRVSAESFRVMGALSRIAADAGARSASALPAPSLPKPVETAPQAPPAQPAAAAPTRITQPKAVYRAPPVIAAGVRPRISSPIPIDVRVHVDTRGRVVSASLVTKQHSGLEEYLAARALQAAKLWRFEPARENGKAAPGTQTIHFVFDK